MTTLAHPIADPIAFAADAAPAPACPRASVHENGAAAGGVVGATEASARAAAVSRAVATPALPGALALHAAVLSQPTAAAAAQALAITLARQQTFERVWVVWARGLQLQVLGRSDGRPLPAGAAAQPAATPQDQTLLAAAAECFDQAATVAWPAPKDAAAELPPHGGTPCISRAHAEWARSTAHGGRLIGVASLLLVVDGQRVGTLCLQRSAGTGHNGAGRTATNPAISAAELRQLEHVASLAAPLLWLMTRNERGTWQRWRDALASAWARAHTHRKAQWQLLGVAAAALALLLLLLPWPAQVGGRARLEGAVQRVLAAPADGFVQQVHARAGDNVLAGQALLDLADQDLQLERQRWQSQLAQHLDALASAQARADRTQLVLHQSKADEAQAQLALVDEKLLRSRLVAPFDATVVQGDWSQQLGAPVKEGAELLTLAPLGRYRVIVEVDERDIAGLQAASAGAHGATSGVLTLSALPWDSLPLRLTRISPLAKAVEGRNVFEVEAELLPSPDTTAAGLRPGLQGRAQLDTAPASPLLHGLRRALGAARVAWWAWWG